MSGRTKASAKGKAGMATFLEKLARAERQLADEGHKQAKGLRVRAEKNERTASKLRG